MFNILVQREIKKPIHTVFSVLSDHANYQQFKGVDKSSLVQQGDTDKNGVGAIREIVASGSTLHEKIVRFEAPKKDECENNQTNKAVLGYLIVYSKPLPYQHELGEITLTSSGDNTHVQWVSKGKIKMPILGPLYFDKQIQKHGARAFGSILKFIDNL